VDVAVVVGVGVRKDAVLEDAVALRHRHWEMVGRGLA